MGCGAGDVRGVGARRDIGTSGTSMRAWCSSRNAASQGLACRDASGVRRSCVLGVDCWDGSAPAVRPGFAGRRTIHAALGDVTL